MKLHLDDLNQVIFRRLETIREFIRRIEAIVNYLLIVVLRSLCKVILLK